MPLKGLAEDYFSSLNPIASRMYADMRETRLAYEDMWHTIPEKEQREILSESIMDPEVTIKYQPSSINNIREYAIKFVVDDNCSYRDEHSGPFSFKTRSQRDLRICEPEEDTQEVQRRPKIAPKKQSKPKTVQVYESKDMVDFGSEDSFGDTLPKTGLDFLDNW